MPHFEASVNEPLMCASEFARRDPEKKYLENKFIFVCGRGEGGWECNKGKWM